MSYLYRTGNGRNNIAYTNTANSSTKYLRRLGSGRTNINWYTIPQGSTYNILQRNGTGRNNILWSNLNIPKPAGSPVYSSDIPVALTVQTSSVRNAAYFRFYEAAYRKGCAAFSGTRPNSHDIRSMTNMVASSYYYNGMPECDNVAYLAYRPDDTAPKNNIQTYVKKITVYSSNNTNQYITYHVSSYWFTSASIEFGISEVKSTIGTSYAQMHEWFSGVGTINVVLSSSW